MIRVFFVIVTAMIQSVARILERSLPAGIAEPLRVERQLCIDANESPSARIVSQALLNLAVTRPSLATHIMNTLVLPMGVEYVGAGVEFSVYRLRGKDFVVKIHRKSTEMIEEQRLTLLEQKIAAHTRLTAFMGSLVLNQVASIGRHILGGYRTLRIQQPYVRFSAHATPFVLDMPEVSGHNLDQIMQIESGIREELNVFIDRSRRMYKELGELPDTNGSNNVVMQTGGHIVLLDSTPVTLKDAAVQELILAQLGSLERWLKTGST